MKKVIWTLLLLGLSAFGDSTSSPMLAGHNFTPTSYTLKNKQITLGTYVIGFGITDNWTVGTCPWLLTAYNMPMIETKYAIQTDSFFQRVSLDANYFKTFAYFKNLYKQESVFIRLTGTHRFDELYALHVSLGYQYFFDDEHPFSLRLIPGKATPVNLNLTTLSEFQLSPHFGAFAEFGLAGLNYSVLWLHTGLSGFYKWDWGMAQLGFSRTVSLGQVPYYTNGDTAQVVYWHPEIQLQFFL